MEIALKENVFRVLAGLIFVSGLGISGYFRRKADRESGGSVSRRVDGSVMMTTIRIGGLLLWLSPLLYLIHPGWMAWSRAGLPG